MPTCTRKACDRKLDRGYYKIWNEPSTNEPRLYCVPCGRKIIEHNRGSTLELRYEIVQATKSDEPTVESVREHFRNCLFGLCFDVGHIELATGEKKDGLKDVVANIAAIGCNSKLLSREEYDDWMAVLQDKMVLGDMMQKWFKEDQ